MKKKRGYWTKERCHVEALKYNNKNDFQKNSYAYRAALKMKCLDEICSHMVKRTPKEYWTKEKCNEISIKYSCKDDFRLNDFHVYNIAYKMRFLNDICNHMRMNKPKGYWTKERCHVEALKYNKPSDFWFNSKTAYKISRINGWLNEICSHMTDGNKKYEKLNFDYRKCHKEALKYNRKTHFLKKSYQIFMFSKKMGWMKNMCAHMKKNRK